MSIKRQRPFEDSQGNYSVFSGRTEDYFTLGPRPKFEQNPDPKQKNVATMPPGMSLPNLYNSLYDSFFYFLPELQKKRFELYEKEHAYQTDLDAAILNASSLPETTDWTLITEQKRVLDKRKNDIGSEIDEFNKLMWTMENDLVEEIKKNPQLLNVVFQRNDESLTVLSAAIKFDLTYMLKVFLGLSFFYVKNHLITIKMTIVEKKKILEGLNAQIRHYISDKDMVDLLNNCINTLEEIMITPEQGEVYYKKNDNPKFYISKDFETRFNNFFNLRNDTPDTQATVLSDFTQSQTTQQSQGESEVQTNNPFSDDMSIATVKTSNSVITYVTDTKPFGYNGGSGGKKLRKTKSKRNTKRKSKKARKSKLKRKSK